MKSILIILAIAAALAFPAIAAPKKTDIPATQTPVPEKADFTGRYERAAEGKSVFILHVRQNGDTADIEFSASNADGTGAAPDGNGSGALNDKGELEFTFEDSLGNKGKAALKKTGRTFQITMKAETVADPRAVKFYGVIALKRTPDREN